MWNLILMFALAMLVGCAQPVLDIPEPSEGARASARATLDDTSLAPAPTPASGGPLDMKARLDAVLPNIKASAWEVCRELELESARCIEAFLAPVTFFVSRQEINAYANQHDEVGVFAGLVRELREEEIAAAVAHELAHIMFGHVQKKMKNALTGMAIAGGLAAVYAGYTRSDASTYGEDWMRTGMAAGSRAYSPEMEIEADRLAVYILKDAGYPSVAMRDVIVRLHRAKLPKRRGLFSLNRVGFLQTHPSNDRRIAHILAAVRDAESGVPLDAHVRSP